MNKIYEIIEENKWEPMPHGFFSSKGNAIKIGYKKIIRRWIEEENMKGMKNFTHHMSKNDKLILEYQDIKDNNRTHMVKYSIVEHDVDV